MTLDLVAELWVEIKRYVSTSDRADAADALTGLLVEHGIDLDEIRTAFKSDSDVKRALQSFSHDDVEPEEDEEEDYDDNWAEDDDY
jgi:hypothetical protein